MSTGGNTPNTTHTSFFPQALDSDGNAIIPSSFKIDKIKLINHSNGGFDLHIDEKVVSKVQIAMDLFTPITYCYIHIHDNINFFAKAGLEGYENVEIHLSNEGDNIKEPSSLKLDLKIESFPNFEKTGTGINVQEYIIQCVTHVATRSKQQRISLALGGTDNSATVESILQIFKEYLGVEPDSIQGWDEAEKNTGLPWQGVITYMTPLQAIDLIRRQAFSSQGGAPLMIFPILGEKITEDGKLKFKMGYLDDILDGPIYEPTDKSYYAYNERTDLKVSDLGYIDFLKRQILGISSDMKLNKLEDARAGRYGSKVSITDYANKIYKADLYIGNGIWPPVLDGGSELPSIGPDGNPESYRDPPSLDIDKPETIASSSRRFINTGLPKTNTGIPSSDFIQSQVAAREKFWYSSLNHKHVDFTVHGDFELNVGTHVEIKVPIAADLAEFGQGGLQDFDPLLSGIYMITMVTHTFANGKFTTTLKTIQTPEMYVNALALSGADGKVDAVNFDFVQGLV